MDQKYFKNRISIGHPETLSDEQNNVFYNLIKNTDSSTLSELEDIYFGKYFYYEYNGQTKRYGNCMGVEASDEQINNLFKIQEESGVQISLTMNALELPPEILLDTKIKNQFMDFIQSFYDFGLRSCTIASTHLMSSGELHKRFPEMRWKNTVNHIIYDSQQVIDMIHCGYDTILLDRSLNRNITELKHIKRAVNHFNKNRPVGRKQVKTSLLVKESCLYSCPFKKEHDEMGTDIGGDYFPLISHTTCGRWRKGQDFHELPRAGVDLVYQSKESFKMLSELVDIFKFSGRLGSIPLTEEQSKKSAYVWNFLIVNKTDGVSKWKSDEVMDLDKLVYSNTLENIVNIDAVPLHTWDITWAMGHDEIPEVTRDIYNDTIKNVSDFWLTKESFKLEKVLFRCKSQCWDCHKCEDAFGQEHIDSALEL